MSIVGKCPLMCPTQERTRREKEKRLHILEVDASSSNYSKTSESLAVKEYVRSAAGCDLAREEWLRPPVVLLATVNHLISLTDKNDLAWWKVYEFVDNRMRSVRQDLVIQGSEGIEAIDILEKCTRFYLYSQYRLRLYFDKFDVKLNSDRIGQCLARLTDLYKNNLTLSKNECEMMMYNILYKLGSHDAIMRVLRVERLRDDIAIRQAIKMNKLLLTQNFVKFFKELKHLPTLAQCSLLIHLDDLKRNAWRVIENAYGVSNAVLPLCTVEFWLGFDRTDHALEFIRSQGIKVVNENVMVKKNQSHKVNGHPITCQYHEINELHLKHLPSSLLINGKSH